MLYDIRPHRRADLKLSELAYGTIDAKGYLVTGETIRNINSARGAGQVPGGSEPGFGNNDHVAGHDPDIGRHIAGTQHIVDPHPELLQLVIHQA